MADETILEQDVLTAATIANPAEWFFGVERLGFTTPHQISLSEIGVALVDPVDADITALDARLDAAEAQLLTLVTVTGDITALDGRVTILESGITAATAVVPNVAALTAALPFDGQLYQTLGYYAPSDGGANLYRYDSAAADPVDGGWVQQGPGGAGRYIAIDQSVANVRQFGAVGDGITDDTLPITAALASIPVAGGMLYFPRGRYFGLFEITNRDDIVVAGDGIDSQLLGGGPGNNCIDISTCFNITVRDLWCIASGDSSAGDPHVDSGIRVNASSGVSITRCKFTNHGYAGVFCYNSTSIELSFNRFSDAAGFSSTNASDISIAGTVTISDYRVVGNECVSLNNVGILIQPTVSNLDHKNFVVSDNICRNHVRYGIIAYLNIANQGEQTIKGVATTGNVCENNGWGGIYYQSVDTSTISGNVTRGNGIGGALSGIEGGIHVNGCVGIAVTGNTCYDEIGTGITLNGHLNYTDRRKGVTVTGNTIVNQTTAGHPSIKVGENMSDCSLIGNVIQGSASHGIQVFGTAGIAKTIEIMGNTLDGEGSAARGIDVFGASSSAIITANRVTGFQTGIRIDGAAAVHLRDNNALGNTFDYVSSGVIGDLRLGENKFATISDPATYTQTTITGSSPSVLGRRVVQTANAAPTTMTGFTNGIERQEVIVQFNDANTTVDFSGTTLHGNGDVDWTPALGDHMVCTKIAGAWYCQIADRAPAEEYVANVKLYGATGDGVTDDTAAMNAALASIAATGGVLYFPHGSYVGELEINNKTDIVVSGDGPTSKLLGGGPGTNCIDLIVSSNVTVRDIWCIGSGDSTAANPHVDNCIRINECDEITITRCKLTNHAYAGVFCYGATGIELSFNRFSDAFGFTSTNASDVVIAGVVAIRGYRIIGNECVSTNSAGILVQPTGTNLDHKNLVIANNLCRDHSRYGILVYLNIANQGEDTIKAVAATGNICENNGWAGIYFQAIDSSTISGNVTRGNGIGGVGSGIEGGIQVNGCVGIAVTGNSCFDEIGVGVHVNGHSTFTDRRQGVAVTGNLIVNQTTTGHPAIKIGQQMADCSVVSNNIFGSASQGIHVLGTMGIDKAVEIIGNVLDGLGSASRGIEIFGGDASAMIIGNRVTGYQTGIRLDGAATVHLKDNHAIGNTFDYVSAATIADLRLGENQFATVSDAGTYTQSTISGATPSILGRRIVRTANGSPTTMTALSDGIERQEVIVQFNDANTTVDFTGTTLFGNGGVDWTPALGDHMVCTRIAGNWYCQISDNTA